MFQIYKDNKWTNISDIKIIDLITNYFSNMQVNQNIKHNPNDDHFIKIYGEKEESHYQDDVNNIILKREKLISPLTIHYNLLEKYIILNLNNIKLFIPHIPRNSNLKCPNWHQAYIYQAWAFRNFITSNVQKKKYKSFSSITQDDSYTEIPYEFMYKYNNEKYDLKNIFFSIEFKDNKYYLVREDSSESIISCSLKQMIGFQNYYNRLTAPIYPVIYINNNQNIDIFKNKLNKIIKDYNIKISKTNNNLIQCSICCENKINIKFTPCGHYNTCSDCCLSLKKDECPICRNKINSIKFLTNNDFQNILNKNYVFSK